MLLVLLVLIDKSLAILLVWAQYLGHRQVFYRLVEVVQGAEGLRSSAESLVVQVALLGVPVVKTVGVV